MENLILNKEQDGGYVLYVLDVEGNFVATIELKTAGDYAAALARFSDRILSDSGLPIVDIVDGKAAVVGHMTTEDFHREVLLPLAAEIKENAASDEEAVALVRASLTHPKILSLLARHHERKFLLHVWPDFDEILAGNLSATGNADTVGEVVPPGAPDADPGPDGAQTSQLDIRGSVPPGDSMRAGDPVLLSPGELILEETDLLLPGVGMDLEFSRTYRHRERRSGPFGRVWDHSFNLHLEEAVEYAADGGQRLVVYRSTGEMRWDRYVMHETGGIEHGRVREATFLPPAGAAEMLIKVGGRYRLVANDGKTIYYDERLRGESIEDRNGNRIRLFYEEAHLVRIVDTCSRRVTLRYDDGRLCEIRDEESRRWVRYEYDDAGRLNKVISSTGRVGQPERCHGYIYRGEDTPPGMRSNIVATWNPDGVEMLSVEYGDKLGTLAYNRVVAQEEAGGCWNYRYEPIVALTEDPNSEPHNIARLRVIVESPDGHLHEHEYNDMGRMVAYRFEVGTGVEARRIEHRFRYDHDGRVVREERPGGAVIDYVYRREIHAAVHGDPANAKPEEQLRFGELLKIVEHAAPRGNVPPQRITEFDYGEPARITKRTGPYYADAAGQLLPGQPDLVTQYVYDPEETRAAFVVEEILDPAGLAETRKFKWNAAGQLLRQLDPDGHEVHRSYDHFGRILSEERGPHALNAPPARTELSYTPTGAVREAFARRIGDDGAPDHAGSSVETTEYDRYGRPSRIEERSGDGSCVRTSLFRYDEAGRLAETVDPRGVKTRFEYDARGLVTKRTVAVGTPYQAVYRLRYSVDGQLAEAEGPLGNVQRFHYDGYSRVERTEEPGGTEETSAWDASDRLVQQSTHGRHPDAGPGTLLSELRQEYDEGGRLRTVVQFVFEPGAAAAPVQAHTRYTYDHADRIVAIEDPLGRVTQLEYDAAGRLVSRTDLAGNRSTWNYDVVQRRTVETTTALGVDAAGGQHFETYRTTTVFDPFENPISIEDDLGNRRTFRYSSDGLNAASVDEYGIETRSTWNAFGDISGLEYAVGTPDAVRIEYQRDRVGDLVRTIGPRGRMLAVELDVLGRERVIRFGPSGATESVTRIAYDLLGRVEQQIDGNGVVSTFQYGPDGNVFREVYNRANLAAIPGAPWFNVGGPPEVRFTHDGHGRVVRFEDGNSVIEARYDSLGQILSEDFNGNVLRYAHDLAGHLKRITFPDGRVVSHEYDGASRLTKMEEVASGNNHPGQPAVAALLTARPLGVRAYLQRSLGSEVEAATHRDPAGRLVALEYTALANGALIFRQARVCDSRGISALIQDEDGNTATSRLLDTDAQGRLRRVRRSTAVPPLSNNALRGVAPVANIQTDLDALAAPVRAMVEGDAAAHQMALDVTPEGPRTSVTHTSPGAGPVVTDYVAEGDGRYASVAGLGQTYDAHGNLIADGVHRYTYDQDHRLVAVHAGANLILSLTRDPVGRAVRVVTAQGERSVSYFPFGGLAEVRNAADLPIAHYLYGESQTDLVHIAQDGENYAPLTDFSGSIVAAVTDAGDVVGRWDPGPFGEEPAPAAGPGVTIGFQGMWRPLARGPQLTALRAYDAGTGSFHQPDPLGFADGPFRYGFANGNPYVWSDPLGLASTSQRPIGNLPQHEAEFLVNGVRTKQELAWYERAVAAMGGAVHSIVNLFVESGKQIYDFSGTGIGALGALTGWWDYQHDVASGIGKMAMQGMGTMDIAAQIGRNILDMPGRLKRAAERGDYVGFGAEAMNIYLIARPAASTAARTFGNYGIKAIGRAGKTGQTIQKVVRQIQVDRLKVRAENYLRQKGYESPNDYSWHYGGKGQPGVYGETRIGAAPSKTSPSGNHIVIYEKAFTPGLASRFPLIKLGDPYHIGTKLSTLRFIKGESAMGTAIHEAWHTYQFKTNATWYRLGSIKTDYWKQRIEFTQSPTQQLMGAHNFQWSHAPIGPLKLGTAGAAANNASTQ